jgi:acyl-CoA thioester hydrolase
MHETRIRVRYEDVDPMGVAHHPRYIVWFEVARTRFMRDLGLPYADVMAAGTHLAVVEAGVRYLRAARFDEVLTVTTRCTEVSGARILLEYEVRRGDEVLATGFTRHGAVDGTGRARRTPQRVREVFEAQAAAAE